MCTVCMCMYIYTHVYVGVRINIHVMYMYIIINIIIIHIVEMLLHSQFCIHKYIDAYPYIKRICIYMETAFLNPHVKHYR
jgi:hypothetical protein